MQQRTSWLRDELKRAKEMGLTVQIDDKICQYQNPEEFFLCTGGRTIHVRLFE